MVNVTRLPSPVTRLSLSRTLADSRGCTHLFVSDPVDVEYLSGFHSSNAFLLIGRRENYLFTDFRYQEAVKKHCARHPEWRAVLIKGPVYSSLADHLPARSVVGFQSGILTVDAFEKMKKALSKGCRLLPLARSISDLSIVKFPAEVSAMRKAAAIADAALSKVCSNLRPGITEKEGAALLDRLCSSGGSEKPSFDTIMLFGANSALPHGRPGTKKLSRGDFVLIDFGCTVGGFCSDMTRTFVFGKASARQRKLHALVLEAQSAARAAARAAMKASDLDAVARTIIKNAGHGEAFGHGLGHGVGRRIHEEPRLNEKSKDYLQGGSVVTIEPGIYLPGFGGVRIEDMVVLTEKGSKLLTRFPRELVEM